MILGLDYETLKTNVSLHDMNFKLDLKKKMSFHVIYECIIDWDASCLYHMPWQNDCNSLRRYCKVLS